MKTKDIYPTTSKAPKSMRPTEFTTSEGTVLIDDARWAEAEQIRQEIRHIRNQGRWLLAERLDRVISEHLYIDMLHNAHGDIIDSHGIVARPLNDLLRQWCREYMGWRSHVQARELVRVWRELYLPYQSIFEELDEVPPINRLRYLAAKSDHAQIEAGITASVMPFADWEALKLELFEDVPEEEADAAAQDALEEIREKNHKAEKLEKKAAAAKSSRVWKSADFRAWTRTQPCIFTGVQNLKEVDPCHILTKGAGWDDYENIVPMHNAMHQKQHEQGWDDFLLHNDKKYRWLQEQAMQHMKNYLFFLESEEPG